jgi:hypothetical protein
MHYQVLEGLGELINDEPIGSLKRKVSIGLLQSAREPTQEEKRLKAQSPGSLQCHSGGPTHRHFQRE